MLWAAGDHLGMMASHAAAAGLPGQEHPITRSEPHPVFTELAFQHHKALLHRLPRNVLRRVRLLVRPDTVLPWHRDLLARRHAARSLPKRPGRPRTVRSVRVLVLRLTRENPGWGYRRIHGELLVLGAQVAASTVWEILKEAGTGPAPERASPTWASFQRSQADALLACDFFETVTLTGARLYAFAVIEHANRRIRILGATAHPTASWVAQAAAKNLVMDLEDAGCRAEFLIRDRDGKFPTLFDAVRKDAGIEVVLSGIRMPRMNAFMERWIQTCRRELLDRTLIWKQRQPGWRPPRPTRRGRGRNGRVRRSWPGSGHGRTPGGPARSPRRRAG
ncbi:integrase [Streptomyces spinoverrucosus]|uniref:integrase n=1 Tax=Streptomyces spinoverrucosus TaxID=284043 RepID=UPI0027DA0382|nr:integrase [Streptomyces spinoverrucosus]